MNRDLDITPPNQWCREQFEAYDSAMILWKDLLNSPQTDSVSGVIRSAKIKRAERLLTMADAKANAAEFIRILSDAVTSGEISISLPSADLEVRLKW